MEGEALSRSKRRCQKGATPLKPEDLRKIAECLNEWRSNAPDSFDVTKQFANAMQDSTPRLCGMSLLEFQEAL
jgi:hypothetical protein